MSDSKWSKWRRHNMGLPLRQSSWNVAKKLQTMGCGLMLLCVFYMFDHAGGMNQTDSFFQELKCHDSIALVNNQASVNSCVINNCYDDSLEGDGDVTADLCEFFYPH